MIKDLIYMTIGGIICMLCSIRFFIISDIEMANLSLVFGAGLSLCGIIVLTSELINGEKK